MNAVTPIEKDDTLARIRKDLKANGKLMGRKEVKFLVKCYYEFQKERIISNNRIKAVERNGAEPVACLSFFMSHFEELEKTMITPLKAYVENDEVGQWLIKNKGIGPVIAAGFLSFLDITRAPSASHFISHAGFDPSMSWDTDKGQWKRTITKHNPVTGQRDFIGEQLLGRKRPFNLELKTLCFKFSKSIVMVGKGDLYRQIYDERKALEIQRNAAGQFQAQAFALLERINKGKIQDLVQDDDDDEKTPEEKEAEIKSYRATLAKGQLVLAHLDARAQRHVKTIFLNHLFEVMYETHYRRKAPQPYALAHLAHVDYIAPPHYVSPYK